MKSQLTLTTNAKEKIKDKLDQIPVFGQGLKNIIGNTMRSEYETEKLGF